MTLKIKKAFMKELCELGDKVKSDEQLNKKILKEHLKYVPHKKLYKFRTCSEQNFKTLEENCIWMAPASSFYDKFDNTINIDILQNQKEIEQWLYDTFPLLCFDMVKKAYEDKGINIPYTIDDYHEYVNTCIDAEGNPIEDKEKAFLMKHATPEELDQMDLIFQQLNVLRQSFTDKLDDMVENINKIICDIRMHFREATLIYCMTEKYDNYTLWENYADNYKGFCIEYSFKDFDKQSFDDYKNLVFMFPMTYTNKKPYFDIVPFVDGAFKRALYQDDSLIDDPGLNADLNMQLYYKNKDYEYEHEWRFSINNEKNNKQYFRELRRFKESNKCQQYNRHGHRLP